MRNLGASEKEVADYLGSSAESLVVLTENAEAVNWFIACQTQWRSAGLEGRFTGLDYVGCEVVQRQLGISSGRANFEKLQIMERAVLDALAGREPSQ